MNSTQIINMWLHNDEATYCATLEIARKHTKNGLFDVAHHLHLFVEAKRRGRDEKTDLFSDLLTWAINSVKWEEIAADFMREAAPYQD